ncbi:response regulator transcription factor [Streptomyces sp. WG-D5]
MITPLCPRADTHRGSPEQVAGLRLRLGALDQEDAAADAALTACLMWVAVVLMDVAGSVSDPRAADALVGRAAAALAAVPVAVPVSAPIPRDDGSRPSAHRLTDRELAVLRSLLRQEASLRQIADDLYVSYNTVKTHTRSVYRKLGARSRAEALLRAEELGLIGCVPFTGSGVREPGAPRRTGGTRPACDRRS